MSLTTDPTAVPDAKSVPVDVNGLHDAEYRAYTVKRALQAYAVQSYELRDRYMRAQQFAIADAQFEHANYIMALAREVRVADEKVIL